MQLRHGEPLIFGKDRDRGIRCTGPHTPEVVELGNGVGEDDLLVHDEASSLAYMMMLAEMKPPAFPMPVGVIRRVDAPTVDRGIHDQIEQVTAQRGAGDLHDVIYSGNIWKVD